MSLATERLRTVRRIHSARGEGRDSKDVVFLVYASLLIGVIVAYPAVRALALQLARPEVVAVFEEPQTRAVVGLVCALVLAGLAASGRLRGPVTPSPLFVTLLGATDLPRSLTLRREFGFSALLVTTATTVVGVLLAGVLVAGHAATAVRAGAFVLACGCLGLVGAILWLGGQSARPGRWWLPVALLLAGGVLGWAFPPAMAVLPWGWIGLLWPASSSVAVWPLAGWVLVSAVSVRWVPRLLDALDGERLLDDAERWRSAGTAAAAGDVAHALGSLRARPTIGRRWNAAGGGPAAVRFLRRDLVAGLRTPGRVVIALATMVVGWTLVASSAGSSIGWAPAMAGAALVYLAVGVFADGFRHAAEAASAPVLYGYRTARLYLLHAVLPALIGYVTALAGWVVAVAAGAPPAAAATLAGLLVPVLVLVRAYDSAKGDLPVVLLTPVPTPTGDLSALAVLGWEADALIVAALAGGVSATMLGAESPVRALVVMAVTAGGVVLLLRRRLSRL